jgi:hypothetical protein
MIVRAGVVQRILLRTQISPEDGCARNGRAPRNLPLDPRAIVTCGTDGGFANPNSAAAVK